VFFRSDAEQSKREWLLALSEIAEIIRAIESLLHHHVDPDKISSSELAH
jgi:hypothetical protein